MSLASQLRIRWKKFVAFRSAKECSSRTFAERKATICRRSLVLGYCFLGCMQAFAVDAMPSVSQHSDVELIVVVGADGTREYGEQFDEWSQRWTTLAEQTGMSSVRLGPTAKRSGSDGQDGDAEMTDRDLLKNAIAEVKPESPRPLWLVMIGHGTFTRGVAKFNLRGPDVSAKELAVWLKPLKRTVVVINGASCMWSVSQCVVG